MKSTTTGLYWLSAICLVLATSCGPETEPDTGTIPPTQDTGGSDTVEDVTGMDASDATSDVGEDGDGSDQDPDGGPPTDADSGTDLDATDTTRADADTAVAPMDADVDSGPSDDADTATTPDIGPPPDVVSDVPDVDPDLYAGDTTTAPDTPDTTADTADAMTNLVPCCSATNQCSMTTRNNCHNQGATPALAQNSCSGFSCSSLQPCCLQTPNGPLCDYQTATNCSQNGGTSKSGATCSAVSCGGQSISACCLGNRCVATDSTTCQNLGGNFNSGKACNQVSCP